jgi:hypothetical protein
MAWLTDCEQSAPMRVEVECLLNESYAVARYWGLTRRRVEVLLIARRELDHADYVVGTGNIFYLEHLKPGEE